MSTNYNFEIQEVESFLGFELKKVGINQYQGKCPYCAEEGHDRHGDNLNFNPDKGFFCGACANNEHGKKLAQEIIKSKNSNKAIFKKLSKTKYDTGSTKKYSSNLLNNNKMLELVKENTGLTNETIKECKIGYDVENDVFLIPMIALDNTVTGYEIRTPENHKGKFKFISKTKGYANNPEKCLSKINNPSNPQNAFICAGYKDGYAVYEYLKRFNLQDFYQILTNTNGEGNTAKALKPHIDYLKQFERIIICMDNDIPGRKAYKKIEQEIPLVFHSFNLGKLNGIIAYINDFADLYKYIQTNAITENILEDNIKISPYSVLKLYLKHTNIKMDMPVSVEVKADHKAIMEFFERGIYPYKGCYYYVKYDSDSGQLTYVKKSNFTLNVTKTVVVNTYSFENHQEYQLEIVTNIGNKTTKPITLSQKELLDLKNLHDVLKEGGIHLHCLKDTELKNILLEELSNIPEELNIFKNPSLIFHNDSPFWIYKNAAVDLKNGNILTPKANSKGVIQLDYNNSFTLKTDRDMYAPELYIPEMSYSEFVEQNKNNELIKEFSATSTSIEELIAKCVFVNTIRTYGNKVEPLLTIGTAIMSPFVDIIFSKTMGFPVNFMYGEAASGKSNLLITIAYLFGFNTRFLSSGNDTAMNLLHNMEYYKNIPILYAEVEGYMRKNFEATTKAVYDRNSRKRMTGYGKEQDVRAVNATLNFASNDRAHRNPQTATRLMYTEFYKNDFSPEEASKINQIREKYLSCVLPKILKWYTDKDTILKRLNKNTKIVLKNNSNLDLRCVNNIAIAMCGMDILYKVANFSKDFKSGKEIQILNQNLENYIKSYQDITHTEDCFEKFMAIFLILAKSNKIQYGSEYVFNPQKNEISIYVDGVHPLFSKEFKQSEETGIPIPSAKDIRTQATKEPYIEYNNKYFRKGNSPRALIIKVPEDNAKLLYILNELQKHQEELSEQEYQHDKKAQTQYSQDRAGEVI